METTRAEQIKARSRFKYTVLSGAEYLLCRPTKLTLLGEKLPALFLNAEKADDDDGLTPTAEEAVGVKPAIDSDMQAAAIDFIKSVLKGHMVEPSFFDGPAAKCPPESVTFQDMGDEAMEVAEALLGCVLGEKGKTAFAAVGRFLTNE